MVQTHATQTTRAHFAVHSTGDALSQSVGLFVDFLVHVVGCIPQFGFAPRFFQYRDAGFHSMTSNGGDAEGITLDQRNVTVLQVNHALCVRRERMRVT